MMRSLLFRAAWCVLSIAATGVAVAQTTDTIPTVAVNAATTVSAEDILTYTAEPLTFDPTLEEYTTAADVLGIETTGSLAEQINLPETPLTETELETLLGRTSRSKPITAMGAVCRALGRNQELRIQLLSPEISHTSIESALSEFDTILNASVFARESKSSTLGPRARDVEDDTRVEERRISRNRDASVSIGGLLPTGTTYDIAASLNRSSSDSSYPFFTGEVNMQITQSLLRGAGYDINMINVWTAKNNFVSSLYNLQSFLINLVSDVQSTYWDLYLASRTLEIQQTSYEIAKQQVNEVTELVRVGRATSLDYMSARAEEASRVSDVYNAAAAVKRQAVNFALLLNPELSDEGLVEFFSPIESPYLPGEAIDTAQHIRLARTYRPDLRQAQIDLANGELSVVETANGLLPSLDFVVEAGVTGGGDDTGDVAEKLWDGQYPNWRVGLQFSYALQNRSARAAYRRAEFQREQAEESLRNFEQVIAADIQLAVIEIERTTRLIDSTKITRMLREKELEAEQEKFRIGQSTQLLVNQALRDLTSAKLQEVSAEVANIKSYLSLYQIEGTALQRVGVSPVMITPESGVP